MSRTILVTGGAGYIGSHFCLRAAEAGYTPVCYDNLTTGWRDFVRFGPLEIGDIRDRARLDQAFARHKPEAVVHFAARAEVAESVADPVGYFDNNLGGTITLAGACAAHGVGRIVFSSTAAVYGMPGVSPIPLDTPKAPVNPYGESKLCAERVLAASAPASGISVFALRYFNVAGGDPDGRVGERHEPESHLIPNVLAAAYEGRAVRLFGDDYPTRDGTCIRDYIHVCDLVDAHLKALKADAAPGEMRVYNLGVGRGYSLNEVVDAAERVVGRKIERRIEGRRPGDPPELVAGDTARARDALGWEPQFTDIGEMVAHAWRWYQALRQQRGG